MITENPWKAYLEHLDAGNKEVFFFSGSPEIGGNTYYVHQAIQHVFCENAGKKRRVASIRLENNMSRNSSRIPKTLSLSIAILEEEQGHLRFMVIKTVSSDFFTKKELRKRLFLILAELVQNHLSGTREEISTLLEQTIEYRKVYENDSEFFLSCTDKWL